MCDYKVIQSELACAVKLNENQLGRNFTASISLAPNISCNRGKKKYGIVQASTPDTVPASWLGTQANRMAISMHHLLVPVARLK